MKALMAILVAVILSGCSTTGSFTLLELDARSAEQIAAASDNDEVALDAVTDVGVLEKVWQALSSVVDARLRI